MDTIEIASSGTETTQNYEDRNGIERVALQDLSYGEFFERYMRPNRAVIITSVADGWDCFKRWIDRSVHPHRLDVQFLRGKLPNLTVPVADCGKQQYNAHEKTEMKLFDFLDCWDGQRNAEVRSRYYLKDWHLRSAVPEYEFYKTPPFFASDWLNEYLLDRGTDDYRFVYMGPAGTWTAFHADVFGSFSWSVNIFGEKLWYLLVPGEEAKLRDGLQNLPFRVTEDELQNAGVRYCTVNQRPGEAIFVPTGWYHQVLNVEDAISVNHNWFNACNVAAVWRNLRAALQDVLREIDDCRDMENFDEHSQLMLKASFGMDYADFVDILCYICDKRMALLAAEGESRKGDPPAEYTLGRNHAAFDLVTIETLLSAVLESRAFSSTPAVEESASTTGVIAKSLQLWCRGK
ncbi:2-oxoglutarate and iron-dependent oxygenase JMJD4 homolog [Anopheles aquasalis]|uniref:2-oxoglutarate and iron-dependent oxygenase JMJD4 homolog n=1 Tax=Anopheles aquasalis TaxID=42839 RepID=UPI00215B6065|nr:2-oxoglutarate and iron-dependent oxygenase JMJD4 homolog [Anopheles aquasalis]